MFTGNIRIGAGGTLLRRTNSAERLTVTSGRNYEELQQLLDELHTNVKQAKDIQAKLSKQMSPAEDSGDVGFPPPPETPPPPPLRTSSRLSLTTAMQSYFQIGQCHAGSSLNCLALLLFRLSPHSSAI